MCKTWSIKYSCNHIVFFRLSTCRGIFVTQSKPTREPKPACSRCPVFSFRSKLECGPCERAKIEEPMLERVARLRLPPEWAEEDENEFDASVDESIGDREEENNQLSQAFQSIVDENKELADAIAEQGRIQHQLSSLYPGTEQPKKFRQPEKGKRTIGKSKLRFWVSVDNSEIGNEPVEMDGVNEEDAAWYEDWAGGAWSENGSVVACENEDELAAWMAEYNNAQDASGENMFDRYLDMAEQRDSPPISSDPKSSPDGSLLSPPTSMSPPSLDHKLKEPQPFSFLPTITTILIESESEKENFPPSTQLFVKALPPHLRRRKSFTITNHATVSSSDNSGKLDIEVRKRIRCLNSWIVIGSS